MYGKDDFSEEKVTERRAHGLAIVYTCLKVRSETIASLPINVYREDDKGNKQSIPDHPVYYPLAQQPNNYMSSANMALTSMLHSDSWGNSYIGINRNGRGVVQTMDLIMPWDMDQVKVVDGQAFYKVRGEVYASRDILHYRWWSLDGLNGISPIRQNMITMGKAFKTERYSTYALGKKPPGALKYQGVQSPTQRAESQKSWEADMSSGRTPILTGNWDYLPFLINPDEAQYIETEGLSDTRICGIYRTPPVFVQNFQRATWTNAEQSDLIFAKHTITPLVRVIEQENNMKLFSEREKKNTYMKYNMNGLLRGDTKTRGEFYTMMRNTGAYNANEIREREDENGYPGGEIYTIQSANIPVDQLRSFYENKVAPSAEPLKSNLNGHRNGHEILN
jgi:HK97 family phage portal protein